MTDLDDALNTSAPVFAPPTLTAFWREELPNLETAGNPDALIYLDSQMTGAYQVAHSLDDGLPDPVTMTTGNDASGVATVPLSGRQGVYAENIGWRTPRTETGSVAGANSVYEMAPPSDAFFGDYVIAVVTINKDASTTVTQAPGINDEVWDQLIGPVTDGTLSMYVFGKRYWPGTSGLRLSFSTATTSFSFIACGAYARAANRSVWVDFAPLRGNGIGEASSVSSHSAPSVRLDRRGYAVSFWGLPSGSAAGPMAYASTGVEIAEITTGLRLMMAVTGVLQPGTYALQTTTSGGATNVMVMASLALEIKDRPSMDARQFFSPFNADSPVYNYDRDTAETYLVNNVVTPVGVVSTTIHSGQMADIGITGRTAELRAISQARLDLDKSLLLPVVSGDREACSIDWLATWVMARGGMYAGPGPTRYTRAWAPCYGSVHAHFASGYSYSGAIYHDRYRDPSGPWSLRPPTSIQGPFMSAMFARQDDYIIEEPFVNLLRLDLAKTSGLPVKYGSDGSDWTFAPQMVKTQSAGRIVFWVRGDKVSPTPAYVGAGDQFLVRYDLYCLNSVGNYLGYVMITLNSTNRYVHVRMGADHTGSTTVIYNLAGQQIPEDYQWHFVGVKWNYATGQVEVSVDGNVSISNAYAVAGDNDTSLLPDTEEQLVAAGGKYTNYFRAHIPFSDILLEAGPEAFSRDWSDHYPIPYGLNTTMRPTFQQLIAVAESAPVQGWDLLVKLAQASMSAYRINEADLLEFLPPKYFGEAEQMTPSMVADTEVNASELNVITDPSKTRNVVTVSFPETRVDSKYSPVMDLTASIALPKGTSDVVFSLDRVAVEIHGQSQPFGSIWNLTLLSSAQIASPTTIPTNVHYFTANTIEDGSGTVLTSLSVTARIVSTTASTVTVRFVNKTGKVIYLANNGDQVPSVRLLGYGLTVTDGYVTVRDPGSVTKRKERPLDVEMDWIQDRETATQIAQSLTVTLARPRPQVTVEVMGDPRRVPGQLVTLADSQGTKAEGTWRIMSVEHNGDGPKYTQQLSLVQVLPVGVWDETNWDESVWAP